MMQQGGREARTFAHVSPGWTKLDPDNLYQPRIDAPRRPTSSRGKKKEASRSAPVLACLNCRPKKVKCQLVNSSCRRCIKLGLECFVPKEDERRFPCSKRAIRELQDRVSQLESELKIAHQALEVQKGTGSGSRKGSTSGRLVDSPPATIPDSPNSPLSLLAAICSGKSQLNRDSAGQLRFFGPTSSLHVTETVTSSILNWDSVDRPSSQWQDLMSPELQHELLQLYWTYQHPTLQVLNKEAFLECMANGRSQYYSELLLCCIFACAARMCCRADIRALSLSENDVPEDEVPYFMRIATSLLEGMSFTCFFLLKPSY